MCRSCRLCCAATRFAHLFFPRDWSTTQGSRHAIQCISSITPLVERTAVQNLTLSVHPTGLVYFDRSSTAVVYLHCGHPFRCGLVLTKVNISSTLVMLRVRVRARPAAHTAGWNPLLPIMCRSCIGRNLAPAAPHSENTRLIVCVGPKRKRAGGRQDYLYACAAGWRTA